MSNTIGTPQSWRRVALSTDGNVIVVHYDNLGPIDLTNLFYAALEKIPHAPIAMELALENYQKNNNA